MHKCGHFQRKFSLNDIKPDSAPLDSGIAFRELESRARGSYLSYTQETDVVKREQIQI